MSPASQMTQAAPAGSTFLTRHADWELFYPRAKPTWPGRMRPAGEAHVRPGVYDCQAQEFRAVDPLADDGLPALARWLEEGELVAYRATQRAVVRVDLASPLADQPPRYAKIMAPERARRVLERTSQAALILAREPPAARVMSGADPVATPRFPEVTGHPDESTVLFEGIDGPSLHDLVMRDRGLVRSALVAVGRALARFHQAPVQDVDLPSGQPGMSSRDWAALTTDQFPELHGLERAASLVDGLHAAGSRLALVHGDLHDRNIVLRHDRVCLLDPDSLRIGDPLEDVGNLTAHLVLRSIQRGASIEEGQRDGRCFLEAYKHASPGFDDMHLAAQLARTLFRLSCLYRFRRRWQAVAPSLLSLSVTTSRSILHARRIIAPR